MKKILLLLIISVAARQAYCQQTTLDIFNAEKQKINKNGFVVLASWSAANIIYGSIAASQSHGADKYFQQMNAIWNSVTLGLSAFSYFTAKKDAGLSYEQSLKKQAGLEKIFLFNSGLDVAYIAGGFYLKEKAKNTIKNTDKLKGYGKSVVLQGSALLLFDAVMYSIHNRHGKQLYHKIKLASTADGIGVLVKL